MTKRNEKKGRIVLLIGSSGVGKSTIIKELLKKADRDYTYIPTVTTRSMRDGETQGSPYYFTPLAEFFDRMINQEFIEFNEVHGEMYGTLREEYEKAMNEGKVILKDIDVLGAIKFKEVFNKDVVTIFIEPENYEVLRKRLEERKSNTLSDMERRLDRHAFEKSIKGYFDYNVTNIRLEDTVTDVSTILNIKEQKGW